MLTTITRWVESVSRWLRPANVDQTIKFGKSRVAIEFTDGGGFVATLGEFSTRGEVADVGAIAQAVIDVTQQRAAAEFVKVNRERMLQDAARLLGN